MIAPTSHQRSLIDSEKNNISGRNASRCDKSEVMDLWSTFWGCSDKVNFSDSVHCSVTASVEKKAPPYLEQLQKEHCTNTNQIVQVYGEKYIYASSLASTEIRPWQMQKNFGPAKRGKECLQNKFCIATSFTNDIL